MEKLSEEMTDLSKMIPRFTEGIFNEVMKLDAEISKLRAEQGCQCELDSDECPIHH
jgi:hypothetical protein